MVSSVLYGFFDFLDGQFVFIRDLLNTVSGVAVLADVVDSYARSFYSCVSTEFVVA